MRLRIVSAVRGSQPSEPPARSAKGARALPRGLALIAVVTASVLAGPALAEAKTVIQLPQTLARQIQQPCVLYSCASDPQTHSNWEKTVASLPFDYCQEFTCNPMDLIADNGFDDNLFPLNPDWAYFVRTGQPPDANALCHHFDDGAPPCTSQPTTRDEAGTFSAARLICPYGRHPYDGSFHGHVNYQPATYQGNLFWEAKSDNIWDDDYSLDLQTVGGHGVTAGNDPGSILIEFDSDETIDHFGSSPWWAQFRDEVDHHPPTGSGGPTFQPGNPPHRPLIAAHAASIDDFIDGRFAVVTGLIGLDTAHTPAAESHPVYAMAIETDRATALNGGTDTWAIFARNWGNEGFCSQDPHPQPAGPMTLRIPWLIRPNRLPVVGRPSAATQVSVTNIQDMWTNLNNGSGQISVLPGEGVAVTLDLPSASDEGLWWGTIDLKWSWKPPARFGSTPQALPPIMGQRPVDRNGAVKGGENSDVEVLADKLLLMLPPAKQAAALAAWPKRQVKVVSHRVRLAMTSPPVAPLRALGNLIVQGVDRAVAGMGRAELRVLCRAYGNHVPRYPTMCRGVS